MQILQGAKKVPVKEGILHCAGVPAGWAYRRTNQEMLDEIKSWHLAKGWADIGYHYLCFLDGAVLQGRPVEKVGAGVIGRNYGYLQILLIERSEVQRIGKFHDFFSDRQRASVRRLANHHHLKNMSGHNDWAAKLCPGFKVRPADFIGWP